MAEQTKQNGIPEALRLTYLTPADCVFSRNENGFLSAEIRGERYPRVLLLRSLPLTAPADNLCVTDVERRELGILAHLADFSPEQQALMTAELDQRYYCPTLTEILDIKEKMGHFYFDVKIGDFKRAFTVKDIAKSIRQLGPSILLTDIDGNRYRIEDFAAIPKKSRRKLEPYLY